MHGRQLQCQVAALSVCCDWMAPPAMGQHSTPRPCNLKGRTWQTPGRLMGISP